MAHINDIVCPRHQLIEIARKVDGAWVLPDGRQIGSGLAIQQTQFLEFAVAE